jgi:hypothetical protein
VSKKILSRNLLLVVLSSCILKKITLKNIQKTPPTISLRPETINIKDFINAELSSKIWTLGYIDVAKFLMYSVPGFQLLKIDPF